MKAKKIFALLLAFSFVLLAGCSGKNDEASTVPDETPTAPASFISDRLTKEELKNENGETCFIIDFTAPTFLNSECRDAYPLELEMKRIYDSAVSSGHTFIKNKVASPNSVYTFSCTYTVTREEEDFVSLRVNTVLQPDEKQLSYTAYGFTFNKQTGEKLNLMDFCAVDNSKFTTAIIDQCEKVLERSSGYAQKFPSEVTIRELIDFDSFFFNEHALNLVFPAGAFSEYKIDSSIVTLPLSEIKNIITLPY